MEVGNSTTSQKAAMSCPACLATQTRPHCGAYNMRCVKCCARLVVSARPNRNAQDALLACITRHPTNPTKPEVIQAIKDHATQHKNQRP